MEILRDWQKAIETACLTEINLVYLSACLMAMQTAQLMEIPRDWRKVMETACLSEKQWDWRKVMQTAEEREEVFVKVRCSRLR
jgi:hypothetical protein